jgi:hypothetical protein
MDNNNETEDRFYILDSLEWENDEGPADFCAIVDEDAGGIVAYAGTWPLAELICKTFRAEYGNVCKEEHDYS